MIRNHTFAQLAEQVARTAAALPDVDRNEPDAMKITLTRSKLYPVVARPGPAWRWTYSYQLDNDQPIAYGTGLAGLRRMLREKHPEAEIVQAWAQTP